MRVRICFAKTESGRYLSHLDLARTIERSLRRAKAPLAFSEGFNPHVKMSFASALAVGITGCREYIDVDLAAQVDVKQFSMALADAFPPALAFVAAEEIREGVKSLSATVNLARYRIEADVSWEDEDKVKAGIDRVLAADELWRKPKEKPGKKTIPAKEVRGLIRRLALIKPSEAPVSEAQCSGADRQPAMNDAYDTGAGAQHIGGEKYPEGAGSTTCKLGMSAQYIGSEKHPAGADTSRDGAGRQPAMGSGRPAVTEAEQPAVRRRITLEAELLMKADGQLQPRELWEMVGTAGGFTPSGPLSVCRRALLIEQGGRVYSPMESVTGG